MHTVAHDRFEDTRPADVSQSAGGDEDMPESVRHTLDENLATPTQHKRLISVHNTPDAVLQDTKRLCLDELIPNTPRLGSSTSR